MLNSRNILLTILCILVKEQGTENKNWYSASEHFLTCIFKVEKNPEKITEIFIKKLH